MKLLHMLVGLPRSGKSTIAKTLNYPIVEPDSIRLAVHGTAWKTETEPLIWGLADTMVRSLFFAGHNNVILDATNHTKKRRQIWESPDYSIKYYPVLTSDLICMERAKESKQEYLIPIIKRMANQLEWPNNAEDC